MPSQCRFATTSALDFVSQFAGASLLWFGSCAAAIIHIFGRDSSHPTPSPSALSRALALPKEMLCELLVEPPLCIRQHREICRHHLTFLRVVLSERYHKRGSRTQSVAAKNYEPERLWRAASKDTLEHLASRLSTSCRCEVRRMGARQALRAALRSQVTMLGLIMHPAVSVPVMFTKRRFAGC